MKKFHWEKELRTYSKQMGVVPDQLFGIFTTLILKTARPFNITDATETRIISQTGSNVNNIAVLEDVRMVEHRFETIQAWSPSVLAKKTVRTPTNAVQ
uniref:Uncharacterized protein n=1 Tax=Haemonchus contortus TaxID=6289 RepID=W6NF12_HAECO